MNEELILKTILHDEKLKNKYWPDVDVETLNLQTLIGTNNEYLKSLHYLFAETRTTKLNSMTGNILKTFGI